MFCQKCGTQIDEEAVFCYHCGTKVVHVDTETQAKDTIAVSAKPEQDSVVMPAQGTIPTESIADYGTDFKTFVDSHVRQTTKFQSAEELLKNSKPQMFLWFCFGIPAVIGLVAGGPLGALLFGLVFGHAARWIAGGIIRNSYIAETGGKFDGGIDISDLLRFLNEHLNYLHPYFHEGKYNAGVLSIPFGIKQKSAAIIHVIPDKEDANSDSWKYVFDAQNNPSVLSRIIGATFFSLIQIYEPRHTCLFKAVPILQAAIEYYLKQYRGGDENVLS